jgi:hypothetical protein
MATASPRKPTAGFWITVALVAVLVGYPLSIGPVCVVWQRADLPSAAATALNKFYEPLVWGCGQSGITANAVEQYIKLWTGRPAYLYSRP